jgi:glyoxylase-like metal-dependent hydrolase (beta-lactamase superfamily II)
MGTMRANLARKDIPLAEIRYALATHYHIDHAGLAQELKLAGVPLLAIDTQLGAIPAMKRWTKPRDRYVEITLDGVVAVRADESRALLASVGVAGQIQHTPGHSDDSVTLLLDDGSAFTGYLTPFGLGAGDSAAAVDASWQLLAAHGALRVYTGHCPIRDRPATAPRADP